MRILRLIALSIIFVSVIGAPGLSAASANLSNSYKTTSNITAGSLVSLDNNHQGYVIPANNGADANLVGVAVAQNNSLLAVNSSSGNVQVALNGVANTLVSTLNGSIAVGDQIGVSPISGVGVKAIPGTRVIGTAQSAFQYSTSGASYSTVTNNKGQKTKVAIGYIPVVIAVSTAPTGTGIKAASGDLQRFASDIVGQSVSVNQSLIAAFITLVALVAVIVLVYGTIRGSLLSIGRNPLAKQEIFESLAQVIGMVCLIIVTAIISILLILR
jgi:hypothetical protein